MSTIDILNAHGIATKAIENKTIHRSNSFSTSTRYNKNKQWKFLIINELLDDKQKKHNVLVKKSNSSHNLSCPLPNPIISKSSNNSLDNLILQNFYQYLKNV